MLQPNIKINTDNVTPGDFHVFIGSLQSELLPEVSQPVQLNTQVRMMYISPHNP